MFRSMFKVILWMTRTAAVFVAGYFATSKLDKMITRRREMRQLKKAEARKA